MQFKDSFKVGDKVACNGYAGRVVAIVSYADMCEVRVPGGLTVVPARELLLIDDKTYACESRTQSGNLPCRR